MHSQQYERRDFHEGGPREGIERLGNTVVEFLRNRTADQWLMFLAGIVVGMILG